MNTWVLGDVHGQYEALRQVFVRSGFDFKRDRLIFLGDSVDRGSAPFECITELMRIDNKVLIWGNHDDAFATFLTPGSGLYWLHDDYTWQKWLVTDKATKALTMQFFHLQVPYFVDEQNRCFTHGGFAPGLSLEEQPPGTFLYDRDLWKEALQCEPGRIPTKDGFTEIFIGHTPTIKFGTTEPMFKAGIWNLDTGAGFEGGKLTLLNLETKAFVQSEPVTVDH